uniref:Secreted protein n=1 Tax=Caenorhabditis japonica TaxID=281687 RepID=A0A8R1HZJ9_CAEJA
MFRFVLLIVSCLALTNADVFGSNSEDGLLSYVGLNNSRINEMLNSDGLKFAGQCYYAVMKEEYNNSSQQPDIKDAQEMLKLADVLRNFSDCLEDTSFDVSIPRFVANTIIFIIENLYGDAYDCIFKSNIEGLFIYCASQYNYTQTMEQLPQEFKNVSYCVAGKLSCSHSDIESFMAATHAGADLFSLLTNEEPGVPVFDSEVYENLYPNID